MEIRFHVPVVPIAQPRQRTRVMQLGGRAIAQNYTPKDSPANATKAAIKLFAKATYDGMQLVGPLSVAIVAVFPRPASKTWKTRPMPREWKTSKPDGDNVAKLVLDALDHLWVDDAQVVDLNIQKFIAAGGEQPHLEITIAEAIDEIVST